MQSDTPTPTTDNAKTKQLDKAAENPNDGVLTTDHGLRIPHTDDSLHVGSRGPTLLEDFHLREKITRFDHERIPERVVHARGSAAHGVFKVYESLAEITEAGFLQDPSRETPVFVRFSTVGGPRGSADTVRDVRGFATKFYTEQGNFDLVGNNMPVFFIQDGIKFPDMIHAVKAEPHNEMPTAASAHDTFWDFVTLVPESAHMLMWLMSDRAIPRSYRMMEGFGVHTFRMVNAEGKESLVKFHWKPLLGIHSLVWDEAVKLAGADCDYHRRDLWQTIDAGGVVEYELGIQVVSDELASKLGIDLLDPTKLIPEEDVPVRKVGKMTLNRNPANAFAETEQVAFCVSNLVPGIGVTDDPLMQARMFSYLDTQLTRLGGPNFAQIRINQPLVPVVNTQQDGAHQQHISQAKAHYTPNTIGGGCPMMAGAGQGGYAHFPQRVEGVKTRARAESFGDHFTQAALFVASLSQPERRHLTKACSFELGKVTRLEIRERSVALLAQVDSVLASDVAKAVGITAPQGVNAPIVSKTSAALSQLRALPRSVHTRRIACLCAPGADLAAITEMGQALQQAGAKLELVSSSAPLIGVGPDGPVLAAHTLETSPSVLFDAVFVAGGQGSVKELSASRAAKVFVDDAYHHGKALAGHADAHTFLNSVLPAGNRDGVVTDGGGALAANFIAAIEVHRHWSREG